MSTPPVAKKRTSVKVAAKNASAGVKTVRRRAPAAEFKRVEEPGYAAEGSAKILMPTRLAPVKKVVSPGVLQAGIERSKVQLVETLSALSSIFTDEYEVGEIGVSISFSVDGKFLGFGTGGATTLNIKIKPRH